MHVEISKGLIYSSDVPLLCLEVVVLTALMASGDSVAPRQRALQLSQAVCLTVTGVFAFCSQYLSPACFVGKDSTPRCCCSEGQTPPVLALAVLPP